MELHLGLALPSNTTAYGFDLNVRSYEHTEALNTQNYFHYKRNSHVEDAFDEIKSAAKGTLSWNNNPDGNHDERKNPENGGGESEEENDVVGWPPIHSWRRKHQGFYDFHNGHAYDNPRVRNDHVARPPPKPPSMYIKAHMEGVAIARKVDISLHRSYQTLTTTLTRMFGKYQKPESCAHGGSETTYVVTYQDMEGDWLLVGDVPWPTFVQTVRRLKIQSIAN